MTASKLICAGPEAPKAQPGQGSRCGLNTSVNNRTGRIIGGALGPDAIAAAIANYAADRVVIDRTGLDATYDFQLDWAVEPSAAPDLPSLFTAIQEQLGLKLESGRGPVDVVAIDRIDRPLPD